MTPETYSELLKDLQKREKTLVPAYLATLRADPALMERLQARFEAAEIGGRFDDFAALCCRRSAVQFLLRTVYVRVLEDLGAVDPPRIRGEWGLAAFREVAPALGVREFLKWTFRDLARDLPALFNAAPEELPLPSEDLCRETWDLWHRMAGDKPVYAWTSDTFDSHFLGELYQDLDAEVRKRFALLQTPPFVEKYILDHTLTPALKEFDPARLRAKGECFRIIDPTCGSGHFLIGGFRRLAEHWQVHGVADPWEAAQRALESVWGCDINPHAVDIARFRLMLEVHARTGVTQLEKLAALTFNLHTMDSLIPWERGATMQGELFPAMDRLARYATPGERAANAHFLHRAFHAVVGNPPYITPKDPQKRDDYRLFWPESAAGKYALSAPFIERFAALGAPEAFIGQITSSSFATRVFGKTLIENLFEKYELSAVIDSSIARIPGHGTPTVILFMRSRTPHKAPVWSVLGKKGDPRSLPEKSAGPAWSAIANARRSFDDSNPYITSTFLEYSHFQSCPWRLGGGAAGAILEALNSAGYPIAKLEPKIGNLTKLIEDDIYIKAPQWLLRGGDQSVISLIEGVDIKDWFIDSGKPIPFPYDRTTRRPLSLDRDSEFYRYSWKFRELMWRRKSRASRFAPLRTIPGAKFYEYPFFAESTLDAENIAFPEVSTHVHFALAGSGLLFKQTSPTIHFRNIASETKLAILGLLNSSTISFWERQTFHAKGGDPSADGSRASSEKWSVYIQRDATKLEDVPLTDAGEQPRAKLAKALTAAARERVQVLPQSIITRTEWPPDQLAEFLRVARLRHDEIVHKMVSLQEELDWLTYGAFGLIDPVPVIDPSDIELLAPGHRPFEILFARADDDADEEEKSAWWSRHGHDRVTEIPPHYSEAMRTRIQARMDLIESDPKLQLIEQAVHKRRWQTPDLDAETKSAAESYLLDRLEDLFAPGGSLSKPTPYRLEQITEAWTSDPRTKAVVRVWKGDVDPALAAEQLLRAQGLPDNPRRLYTPEGLRTLAAWQKTWALQDLEDQGKPLVDPDTGKTLDTIELPPKFDRTHFQSAEAFSIRGKLNVPRERFIVFADLKPQRYGWNGWRDTERALAQVDAYSLAEADPQDPLPPPSAADPRRCGPTLGLWDSLPDVRRWGDASTHAELLALAQEVCGQKSCPCDVVDAWQAHQLQQQRDARAKRPGRKASLPVVQQVAAPVAKPERPPADPDTIAVTIADRDFVFRLIEPFGEGGATIGDLARSWAGQPGLLARVLDDLIASGDLKTHGRGKKKTYIAPSKRRPSET